MKYATSCSCETIVDIETGEIFESPNKFFLDRYSNSPIGEITNALQEIESEILVLSFMARADGILKQKEREIIANYIIFRSGINLEKNLLDKEIKNIYCESSDFRKSLKIIKNNLTIDHKLFFETINEIANSDKKIDPIEFGIIELIKKELKLSL